MFYIYDGKNNSTEIKSEKVLSVVEAGGLVVQRSKEVNDEIIEPLRKGLFNIINRCYGIDIKDLKEIHNHVEHERVELFYKEARSYLNKKLPTKIARLLEMAEIKDFYVHDANVIRFMYPHPFEGVNTERYKIEHLGKLHLHGPHHDHFQNVPLNAINLWGAIEDVFENNGMIIYLDNWGKSIPQKGESADPESFLGRPTFIKLKKGEVLWFHSHHLHSSRVNTSELTRVVFTNRFTSGVPIYKSDRVLHKYIKINSSDNSLSLYLKNAFGSVNTALNVRSRINPTLIPQESKPTRPQGNLENELYKLEKISNISLVFNNGKNHFVVSRFCPHQGVDLLNGTLDGEWIVCPFHGLKVSIQSGQAEPGFNCNHKCVSN